jgi:hypothetical protein
MDHIIDIDSGMAVSGCDTNWSLMIASFDKQLEKKFRKVRFEQKIWLRKKQCVI